MSQGKVSAMGDLYALIKTDVFAYALSKTGNKPDAEDVTQDTFVQIYKNAALYRPMGKPMAWVVTVELNLIRRRAHIANRVTPLDETLAYEEAEEEDFRTRIINNEFLRRILTVLNEEEREVISLHIVSGLKHREIAEILGKPLSTVLSKYNRAIRKLQERVKGEDA